MSISLKQRCQNLIVNLGLAKSADVTSVRRMTGGISSDIVILALPDREICMKFALAKLRVKENWEAPVLRNKAEYDWLSFVANFAPENVPELLGWSEQDCGFAMEYISGDDVYLWKDALLQAKQPRGEAAKVADILGQIHARSTEAGFNQSGFQNHGDFHALRLEPYLRFLANKHSDISSQLNSLVDFHFQSNITLVHGDVSPKNVLFKAGNPIFLDAECATMGDPSFDLSFCLHHLILKALHMPACSQSLFAEVKAFWQAYAAHITWENPQDLETRVAALVPALMLARVDGKSPAEYLSEKTRVKIRTLTIPIIKSPVTSINDVIRAVKNTSET
ncbi:MAG: aminoglycoside phosphotransferase family protein [Rhizobiales bacterium]|nr:aminoglycoside phosphotransferase family protein [Hyphomicrobiales bacterium]NRB12885.1 aminoglycoside phosphotransferase family protein [Hyphomicrobiales bacterium]